MTPPVMTKQELDEKRQRLERARYTAHANSDYPHYIPGISVIVPCFRGERTIEATLRSLIDQSLDFQSYEVIVVFNGEADRSFEIASTLADQHPEFNLRLFFNSNRGAGAARNVALSLVRYANTIFVDADDLVEAEFLTSCLNAMPIEPSIVACPIHNLGETGEIDTANTLNERISLLDGKAVPVTDVPWLLGFNACKLVPTKLLETLRYREDLKSGEDLVFFANLLNIKGLKVVFETSVSNSAYIRRLSDDSVSRQPKSFEFNVKQRVQCLSAVRDIEVGGPAKKARIQLERAQVSFVLRYLEEFPEDEKKLDALLVDMAFVDFPWNWINDGKAQGLVFSYCFLPYADTSAVVAAKAISERGLIVDVISADMSRNRNKDETLRFLCSRFIDKTIEIPVAPSFADWKLNIEFAKNAVAQARRRQEVLGKDYATLYSRALWMGSHIAGALFKIEYPEVIWTAEFSDPLRFDVEGAPRIGELPADTDSVMLREIISSQGPVELEILTSFDLVEALTMVLANELIFTNENQLNYMLSKYPAEFAEMARKKSVVREHPSPRPADYQVVKANPGFHTNRVNIAYFGAFYVNRGLGDIFTALQNLGDTEREKIALHIFCSDTATALRQVGELGLAGIVFVHEYLPYLQFLNAATQADVLLVNDVERSPTMDLNPFLPSKYSDYKASETKIWGVLDPGSQLSRKALDFKSFNGNVPSSLKVMKEILNRAG